MKENLSGGAPAAQPSTEPAAPNSAPADTSNPNIVKAPENANPAPVAPVATVAPVVEAKQPSEQPGSILQKTAEETKKQQEIFGDDWREKLADGDEKALKELNKHKSPVEAIKAYRELQKEFSRTRPMAELAKDATPEQIAEYREKRGIPETWDKYDINLENGIVIGEHDKPIVDKHLQKFHDLNLPPEVVKKVLQSHFEIANEVESESIRGAEAQQKEIVTNLQKEWGAQYKDNLNLIHTHLGNELGTDEVNKLNQARLPDGTYLINNPKILNHFLKQAKEEMGGNTITAGSGNDFISLTARKQQLDKIAAENPKEWFNNPQYRQEAEQIRSALSKSKR